MSGRQAENSMPMQMMTQKLENRIFTEAKVKFNDLAMDLFQFQRQNCEVFRQWTELNEQFPAGRPAEIPFLPVRFFKSHLVASQPDAPEITFSSSTTSGQQPSLHHVIKTAIYEKSYRGAFQECYGDPRQYSWLCLLPGYLERSGSSLVYMAEGLMKGAEKNSGFFLNRHEELLQCLAENESAGRRTLLLGVTFALLNLARDYQGPSLENTVIMETGGMKGRGPELTRAEVHGILKERFGVKSVHSEYGMTELLTQAYSSKDGLFRCPPWMHVMIQDVTDPGAWLPAGRTGRICVIDLANIYSCSFIATDDLGRMHHDGSFEVLGRLDHSEIRGCNLLAQ